MQDAAQREKILSRIQKLITLGCDGGATEAEASSAISLAWKLMVEHNIDMADVEGHEGTPVEEYIEEDLMDWGQAIPKQWNCVGGLLREFFFVKTMRMPYRGANGKLRTKGQVFGTKDNVVIAQHVFRYLNATFPRLWLSYKDGHNAREGARRMFYAGIYHGFADKLRAERKVTVEDAKTSTALVLVGSKLEKAWQQAYPDIGNARKARQITGSHSAYNAGYQHGQNLNVRRPLEGGSAPPSSRLALPGGG